MEKVTTPKFRVSFPHVFQANAFGNNEPKYSIVMLFDKETDLSSLKALAKKAVESKWPDPSKRPGNLRSPFRDGDIEKPDINGYENTIFITASSKSRPGLVDQNVQDIIDEDEFYAGCYARATLTAYAYGGPGTKYTPGVSFGLQNIQKLGEGEAFSGRTKAQDDFDIVDSPKKDIAGAPVVKQDTSESMFA